MTNILDIPFKKGWIAWDKTNKHWRWYENKPVWNKKLKCWKSRFYGQGLSLEMLNVEPIPFSPDCVDIIKVG